MFFVNLRVKEFACSNFTADMAHELRCVDPCAERLPIPIPVDRVDLPFMVYIDQVLCRLGFAGYTDYREIPFACWELPTTRRTFLPRKNGTGHNNTPTILLWGYSIMYVGGLCQEFSKSSSKI